MDQIATFREKYQQGTAYMAEELKSIEKNATGVFREEENRQLEQEYMAAMGQGYVRMRIFGMERTTFGKMDDVSAHGMEHYFEERKEAQRIHQITESGKKKKSAQETDAQARMGDHVNQQIRNSAGDSASHVLRLYREKKEQNATPADTPLEGTEFYTRVKNQNIDAPTREQKISDLMLRRDALALRVKNAAPKNMTGQAECEYEKQLLEKMNDVLRTWLVAGGISKEGKRVSEREKAKAAQHLALAVESYEYYVKNRDRLIGGILFERVKKTDDYKKEYKYWRGVDTESARQVLGIEQPIPNIYKDDIASLRSLISENGPYFEQKQARIMSIYGEYMQHSVAFANMNQEMRAAMHVVQRDPKQTQYVSAWWDKNDYAVRQHEMAMDAATAYLKWLIKGKVPDPTLMVYIGQHWDTDVFSGDFDQNTEKLYGRQDEYKAMMNQRIEQIRAREDLSEQKKDSLIFKLEHSLDNSQNQQAERLLSTSDGEIEYTQFVNQECQVTDNDPNGGGYRDLVRVMMPVNGSVADVDAKESVARKVGLVKFAQGIYLGDQKDEKGEVIGEKRNGMACQKQERLAEIPALMEVLTQAKEDLQQYIDRHAAAFGKQSLQEAYDAVMIPTGAYKKAQGMRDMCSVICQTPLFDELAEADRKQLIELWNFGSGLTDFTRDRVTVIGNTTGRTLSEVLTDPAAIASLGLTLDDAIASAAQMHEQSLAARRNR